MNFEPPIKKGPAPDRERAREELTYKPREGSGAHWIPTDTPALAVRVLCARGEALRCLFRARVALSWTMSAGGIGVRQPGTTPGELDRWTAQPEHREGTRGGQAGRRTMSGEPGTRKVTGRRDRKSVVLDTMLVFTLDFRSAILYTDSAWQTATKNKDHPYLLHRWSETRAAFGGQSSTRGIGKVYGGFFQNARIIKNFLTL